jgi:transketolase
MPGPSGVPLDFRGGNGDRTARPGGGHERRDGPGKSLACFKKTTDRPTLIIVDSHIGYGAPKKQDTSAAHGESLGEEEIRATKKRYGWPEDAKFLVPPEVPEQFKAGLGERGAKLRSESMALFPAFEKKFPELAAETLAIQRREAPKGWDAEIPSFPPDAKGIASRDSSGKILNAIAKHHPWLLGGSADLAPSTKTRLTFEGAGDVSRDSLGGRNLHFGVREHAMGSILNGLALAKLRAYGSGFLIFSDYGKGSLRLAAIMELPVIYIFTHDSIGVGEDGPTHQPVEHLAALRSIPGLIDMRPCDANEVIEAWRVIMGLKHEPVALILSRQALPTLDRTKYGPASGVRRGAYVLSEAANGQPDVLLLATGSEVSLCISAQAELAKQGIHARVVSMPSWKLFEDQDEAYRESVLPSAVRARVSVEQAARFGWERYVGIDGERIGMRTFGESAPLQKLMKKFGFTVDNVVAAARNQVNKNMQTN